MSNQMALSTMKFIGLQVPWVQSGQLSPCEGGLRSLCYVAHETQPQ
jgi:hypothetical protein